MDRSFCIFMTEKLFNNGANVWFECEQGIKSNAKVPNNLQGFENIVCSPISFKILVLEFNFLKIAVYLLFYVSYTSS